MISPTFDTVEDFPKAIIRLNGLKFKKVLYVEKKFKSFIEEIDENDIVEIQIPTNFRPRSGYGLSSFDITIENITKSTSIKIKAWKLYEFWSSMVQLNRLQ